jgi:hypothetical protein
LKRTHPIPDRAYAGRWAVACVLFAAAPLPAAPLRAHQTPPAPVAGATPLDRGLAAIQTDKILADAFFVAADDMGGRDTPSVGMRLTGRFIRNRLERLGWQPGARDGWFQSYPLRQRALDAAGCKAAATGGGDRVELAFASDYCFSPLEIDDLEVDAEVVNLGKVPIGEIEKAGAPLKGRWALLREPADNLPALEVELRKAGAAGVLTTVRGVNGADPQGGAGKVFNLWAAMMRTPRVTWPNESPTFPRVYLPKKTIDKLLELAGVDDPATGQALPLQFSETRRMLAESAVEGENVVGFWPGKDPERAKQVLIVSAHYDHLGVGADGKVYNGADDNGSGVCGLLALAEALAAHGPLECSILLVWVSGEERGLWGSQAFVENPWFPRGARPVGNVNVDMIGRNAPNQILVSPSKAHPARNGLVKRFEAMASKEGFTDIKDADGYSVRSDHANFAKLGIPTMWLFSDVHADYHEPTDDAEKVDVDKIRRVMRATFRMLTELQGDPLERAK